MIRTPSIWLQALLFLAGLLVGRLLPAQEYYFRNFSGKDGLAQSQVYDLLEDRRAFIWMGTWGGGLSRYDGSEFRNFTQAQGLRSNYVLSICEDEAGDLWIGTDQGLCSYDGQQFRAWPSPRNLLVYDISRGREQRLWLATQRGLYYFQDDSIQSYPTTHPLLGNTDLRCCLVDRHGFVWLGGSRGIFVLSPRGNVRHFGIEEGWNGALPFELLEDQTGRIWIATEGGGVQCSDGQSLWMALGRAEGLSSERVVSIHESASGEIWMGTTDAGINIWNPRDSSLRYLQERDGLESNDVRAIVQDSWGNHWVGTSGGGVSKYSGQQFVLYDEADGLIDKEIYGIAEDSTGQLWLSTSRGVSRFDGEGFVHYGRDSGWVATKSRTVLYDSRGQLWMGFDNRGLGRYDRDTFRLYGEVEGVGTGLIRDLVEDTRGRIWVATTGGGITCLSPEPADSLGRGYRIVSYNRQGDFPANYIYDLLLEGRERLWFATRYQGLGFLDTLQGVQLFNTKLGLPDDEVRTLAFDSLGYLWGGTARGGIFRLRLRGDSLELQSFGTREGLSSNNIYQMVFDRVGHLWIGHERGVDRLSLDAAREIAEIVPYGYAEGFRGGETCSNAVICDRRGDLWFGTMNGLTHYRPGSGRKNTVAPRVHLEEVQLFYDPLRQTPYGEWVDSWGGLQPGLQLPHAANSLGFFFRGINHSNQGKVTYEWQLEGYETDWSPRTANRSVNYSNLPPGRYTFKVRAYNEDQVTSELPLAVPFYIRAPFWQRWWFRLGGLLLLLSVVVGLTRWRVNRIRRAAAAERARLELEKKLLQLEQKALQLQMNPHFIFNALNSVQQLIGERDHRKARYQLAKFSKLMRNTLENSRSSRITLAQEIQGLDNYLMLEQFSRGQSFDYHITFDPDLDTEALWIPPMMIQPFVENAIIHGVAQLAERRGKIDLHFTASSTHLRCTVSDNGIGRARARQLSSQREAQHKSTALQVIQERLLLLTQQDLDAPALQIEDLETDGRAAGTRVQLRMPTWPESA
ncbi:MAG: two-component regulator propeller domain-containing protein [Bacteroidota bacterium]